jgi:O-glycosyl hydrolase
MESSMKISNSTLLLCLTALLVWIVSPSRPANAQLDIPGYVPIHPGPNGTLATDVSNPLMIAIDTQDLRQTVHNFGASDAWSIQFVGGWPIEKREAIADLLFAQGLGENKDPKGIALSTWRFNIGAGSKRQTNIGDIWRRADVFYNEDLTDYDWTLFPGQRWFLQAAKARGVTHMTAFTNSPPINMTKNGKAFAGPFVGTTNLADDKVEDFARYLADILAHFRTVEGIDFAAVSPVNEPQWDWNANSGQEGNRYSTSDIKRVIDALAEVDLGNTRIEMPESGENKYFYVDSLDDYIDAFFDPQSPDYVGDKVDMAVAGHSYWTDTLSSGLTNTRNLLRTKLNRYPGMEYTMSEYSILGDYGPGRDLGIDPALFIARTAHFDLTITEASSWQWWLGVSPYDYKDGLVYIDYRRFNGNYYESKMLWAMGNFSRFIRPGMTRVNISRSDGSSPRQDALGLMVSSYVDAPNNIVVSVFVNWTGSAKAVELDYQGMEVDSVIPYVTSSADDLSPYALLSPSDKVEIPARSIVTLIAYHSALSLPPLPATTEVGPDSVRADRPGVIPVSILGSTDVDVNEIDLATLEFGPAGASPAHRDGGHFDEVNGDAFVDLVTHYRVLEAGFAAGDEAACVRGLMTSGRAFEGCDALQVTP